MNYNYIQYVIAAVFGFLQIVCLAGIALSVIQSIKLCRNDTRRAAMVHHQMTYQAGIGEHFIIL